MHAWYSHYESTCITCVNKGCDIEGVYNCESLVLLNECILKESSSANKEVPYMESSAPYKELPHTSPPIPAYRLLGGTMKEIVREKLSYTVFFCDAMLCLLLQTHHMPLPGYGQCGTIWVTYHIPGGTQGPNHPNPGHQYSELKLRVFLPDNFEGRRVFEVSSAFSFLFFTIL